MAEATRSAERRRFLTASGLATAAVAPLAGDASTRRYFRLTPRRGRTLILMDAPPASSGPLAPFLRAGSVFGDAGLSVPRIEAADEVGGFLLMEDFGDSGFPFVITSDPGSEKTLYSEAIRAILVLQREASARDLPRQDSAARAALALPAYRDYARLGAGSTAEAEFLHELQAALAEHAPELGVVIHRDCHADNLVWLPSRRGIARVGWLDFQDAEAGHPAYDPVSLLKDARRELAPGLESCLIDLFVAESGTDPAEFAGAYAALGAQRNLRILGIFARLCRDRGKPAYLDLLPRVWRHLTDSLAHPALARLRRRVLADLPPPDATTLRRLRETCPTAPTP